VFWCREDHGLHRTIKVHYRAGYQLLNPDERVSHHHCQDALPNRLWYILINSVLSKSGFNAFVDRARLGNSNVLSLKRLISHRFLAWGTFYIAWGLWNRIWWSTAIHEEHTWIEPSSCRAYSGRPWASIHYLEKGPNGLVAWGRVTMPGRSYNKRDHLGVKDPRSALWNAAVKQNLLKYYNHNR
jgi:hypothetical protein